jgi:hypothetical protein
MCWEPVVMGTADRTETNPLAGMVMAQTLALFEKAV